MLPVALAISDELERHGKECHERKQAIKVANSATNGKNILQTHSIKFAIDRGDRINGKPTTK